MSNRSFRLFLLVFALLLASLPAVAGVYRVRAGSEAPTPDGATWETAYPTIQNAIDAAVAAGACESDPAEVWVAAGTYTGDGEDVVTMRQHVYLYGGFDGAETARSERDWAANESLIDAEETRRGVLGVANATLDGFTLTRGTAQDGGGMDGGTAENCTFTGNTATHYGGGMNGGTATNCTFTENTATYYGGGGMSSGTATNCTFTGNMAGGGGGMYNGTATDCTFTGNTASSGGAMYNYDSSPAVTNCMFMSNSAAYGGGMHNASSSPVVTNCTFTLNTALGGGGMHDYDSSPALTNCMFMSNSAAYGGGMHNAYSPSPMLMNCTFTSNSAAASGGGIYNDNCSLVAVNCVFAANRAEFYAGGAIYNVTSSPDTCSLMNCTFVENFARASGGGIESGSHCALTVSNCILWNNAPQAISGSATAIVTYSCVQGGFTGQSNIETDPMMVGAPYSVALRTGSPCVNAGSIEGAPDTDIQGRPRPGSSGGVDMGAHEGTIPINDIVTLALSVDPSDSSVTVPPAGTYTYARGEVAPILVLTEGKRFSHWKGDASGNKPLARIVMDADKSVSAEFVANIYRVDATSTASVPDGRSWETAYPDLQAAVDAAAEASGGEVWVAAGTYTTASDTVLTMKEGVALYGGFGGGEIERNQRNWGTNTTTIDGEDARRCATGASRAILDGFTITRGWASSGGGILNGSLCSPTVVNCAFTGNTGGGMCNEGYCSPTLTNCTFAGNTATHGAGVFNGLYCSPTIVDCTFVGNAADGYGGGIYSYYSSCTLSHCTLSENTAGGGGGMYNNSSVDVIAGSRFSDNWADSGAAIYTEISQTTATNSIFWRNAASGGGGAFKNTRGALAVTNCTLVGNTGPYGSVLYMNGFSSRSQFLNCILWDNPGEHGPMWGTGSATVTYSCVQGGREGEGNITGDPLFVDAAGGALWLLPNSPCIDAGTAQGAPETDIQGTLRPQGNGVDMGAYEYGNAILSPVHSGTIVAGDSLRFIGAESDGPTAAYRWDFGDGRSAAGSDAGLVAFSEAGEYTVTYSAASGGGDYRQIGSLTITVVEDTGNLPDLAIVSGSVDAPPSLAVGQTLQVTYVARNVGPGAIGGETWVDAVYLSSDAHLSTDDRRMGTTSISLDLGADETYSGQITVIVPTVTDGSYHLITTVDDTWAVVDRRRANNQETSAVSVYIPELEEGLPHTAAYDSGSFTHYYRLDAQAGANPVVSILPQDLPGLTMSARLDELPTPDEYDFGTQDNVLVIPAEADGTWYLRVHGAYLAQAGAYSISCDTVSMALLEVTPNRIAIGATARFVLSGAGFAGAMGVDLVNAEGVAYPAGSVTVASYTRMTAEYGADALPEGKYAVRVTAPGGGTSELADAVDVLPYVTVEAGTFGVWSGWVRVQGTVTIPAGRTLEIQPGALVEFANGAGLTVSGVLDAQGSAERPVRFTSVKDLDPEQEAAPGDWAGLSVTGTGSLTLRNFEIGYAVTAINADNQGAKVSLFDGVIHDNSGHGLYVYSPYVETVGENIVFANNGYTALFLRADSRHVYRNCTIVGNGFRGGSGWYAAGIHHGASNITLENCIVAFNRNGIDHSGDVPSVTIWNSLFHNPAGSNYVNPRPSEADIFERDGNMVADPLFVDHEAGDYQLGQGSPAIDSGRGLRASEADLLGRARFDDLGMPNAGTGLPPYVDRGAYERQDYTQSADLALGAFTRPTPESVGASESFAVEWTVVNQGTLDAEGPWDDVIYLSKVPHVTPGMVPLTTRTFDDTLAAGGRYTRSAMLTAPAEGGVYYLLLRTDNGRAVSESVLKNNDLFADGHLAVGLPVLSSGNAATGSAANGQWSYIRLDATAGNTLLLQLAQLAQQGTVGLYVRFGAPPTLTDYDLQTSGSASEQQALRILSPLDGVYYVGIYGTGLPGDTANYSLSAETTPASVAAVVPNRVGNAGRATLEIKGDNFHSQSVVRLQNAGGGTITAEEVRYWDPATIYATFALKDGGAAAGVYSVVVTDPDDNQVMLANGLTVVQGGAPDLRARISMPGVTRPGRVVDVLVEYSNQGLVDLPSPLLTLRANHDDCEWQVPGTEDWITDGKLRLLALSTTGPATVLRPGQGETLTVPLRVPFRPEQVTVNLASLGITDGDGSSLPVDWAREFLLGDAPEEDPDLADIVQEAEDALGTTWGEYVKALRQTADLCASYGHYVFHEGQLREFRLMRHAVEAGKEANGTEGGQSGGFAEQGKYDPPSRPTRVYQWNKTTNTWDTAIGPYPGKTVVLIHGWQDGLFSGYTWSGAAWRAMAKALEGRVDHILGVDWNSFTIEGLPVGAAKAASRIPSAAADAYYQLAARNVNPSNTHLIGHSHGAHVAGLIGNRFKAGGKMLKRITALDASQNAVHLNLLNPFGMSWGAAKNSAAFIDFYKSSQFASGYNAPGHDNFLLTESGYSFGARDEAEAHSYAVEWYTRTIVSSGDVDSALGYNWAVRTAWSAYTSKLPGWPRGMPNRPWKGLIRGGNSSSESVLECLSMGMDGAYSGGELWSYPGPWTSLVVDTGSPNILAASIECEIDEESVRVPTDWRASDSQTISFAVTNNADNHSYSETKRRKAQLRYSYSALLSKDNKLDSADLVMKTFDTRKTFDIGETHEFSESVPLPSLEKIRARWPGSSFPGDYYIIVAFGYANNAWASSELCQHNNWEARPIRIDGEDLCAHAGHDMTVYLRDGQTEANVHLDGSRSAPASQIDRYVWSLKGSVLGTGEKISCKLPEGTHQVKLTVTDYGNNGASGGGDDRTDEDTATVRIIGDEDQPDGEDEGSSSTNPQTSYTPEDKFGPGGFVPAGAEAGSEQRFVQPGQMMAYRIEFWNKEDAEVPTQDADIIDDLDPEAFDLSTFEFTRIGFLDWDVYLPAGQTTIDEWIDARPTMNLAVHVTADINRETGRVYWWFHCVDPDTGDYPDDPHVGFLPPFNPVTEYELGWVEYRVRAKAELATSAQIRNQARVRFDFLPYGDPPSVEDRWNEDAWAEGWGAAPKPSPWVNTVDAAAPSSSVNALPALTPNLEFAVSWDGADDQGGSGIRGYDIYLRDNGGPWSLWLPGASQGSAVFSGEEGHTYAFYSVATDNVGNREVKSPHVEASTRVQGSGALVVTIEPQAAVEAGARWRVDGGDWLPSGAETTVAPGTCTVTFNSVSDWLTPPVAAVMIEAGGTANVTGTYLDFGIASVDRLLGLSLGGNIVTLDVVGLSEDTLVYLGDQQAFTTDQSNIDAGLLVVETPSQWPGEYEIRIEDTTSGAEYVFGDPFVYTDNPFESGADQFPGEIRPIQDTPEEVSTAGGSLPVEGGVLQPLEYETPEGVVVEIPVDSLPANATRAFVVIRSSASLQDLFEESVVIPADRVPRSPYVDMHILAELDASGEDAELETTVSAPVVLRFPHYVAPEAWDTLEVGRMDTDLDEQFRSLLPEPVEVMPFDNLVVSLDEQERLVVEVEHFTVYGLLGPTGPAPVSVPDVVGMTQANAEAALRGAGLIVGAITEEHSATVPAGQVISSLPGQGVEVMPGSAVDLVISKGPAASGGGCHGGSPEDSKGDKLLLMLTFGLLSLMAWRRKPAA